MKNDKNFDSHNGDDEQEFQSFLDLLRSGLPFDEESERAINFEDNDDEYPDLNEHFGTDGLDDDICPAMAAISDIIKEKIESIGFLGLRWSDEEMAMILEKLDYEKSTFTIDLELPEDLSEEEAEMMRMVLPEGKLEVDIMKKPGEEISKENFDLHRPKNLFQKEMKDLVIDFILDKISDKHGNSRKEE